MNQNKTAFFSLCALSVSLFSLSTYAQDEEPYELREIKDRDGKEIAKAVYGSRGRIGIFRDVDADGTQEFVALTEDRRDIELSVLELDTDEPRLSFVVGSNEAAGLYALNLDEDAELEYVVAYGSRLQDRVKRTLIQFASALGTLNAGWSIRGTQYYYMYATGVGVDVRNVKALDDDGSVIWDRDLSSDGEAWTNPRIKWLAPDPSGRGGTVLMTDDESNLLLGLSAEDGSTIWERPLDGVRRAANWDFQPLSDGERDLPIMFADGAVLIFDALTGEPVLETSIETRFTRLPSWEIFDTGSGSGFLAYGDDRAELQMISIETGESLWRQSLDRVDQVFPVAGASQLMAVSEDGVRIIDADGSLVAERAAPSEIRRRTTPVYADLNGDGTMEFLFVSEGRSLVAWQPDTGNHLWTGSVSSGMLGAANPAEIFDSFLDIDADGWLDVPARKPSGTGVWLSGRTGETLASVGNGSMAPVVGDFDGNGSAEVFWVKKWYDLVPATDD